MEKDKKHFIKNKLQIIQTSLELLVEQDNKNDEILDLIKIMMYCIEEINTVIEKENIN